MLLAVMLASFGITIARFQFPMHFNIICNMDEFIILLAMLASFRIMLAIYGLAQFFNSLFQDNNNNNNNTASNASIVQCNTSLYVIWNIGTIIFMYIHNTVSHVSIIQYNASHLRLTRFQVCTYFKIIYNMTMHSQPCQHCLA